MDLSEDALILIIIFYIRPIILDLEGTHGACGPDWRLRLPGPGGGHSESSRRPQGDNHWWAHFFFASGRSGRDTILEVFRKGLLILISRYGTFCVCADGFQGFSTAFQYCTLYNFLNFLYAPLKLLINFENSYWNLPQNFLLWLVDVL